VNQGKLEKMKYLYIISTIFFTVYGQVVTKWQVEQAGPMPPEMNEKLLYLLRVTSNPWVISSLIAAFLAFLCWVVALSKFQLSVAYPFMSLSFVLVVLMSAVLFNESVTIFKIAGIMLIVLGIIVGSRA
jgi:multidrug transporter EmrE-like cation transporter